MQVRSPIFRSWHKAGAQCYLKWTLISYRPAASYWNIFSVARDCIPEAPPLMGQTVVTVITDLIVYVLPMPTLWKLQLPLNQRIGLMVLFGFGGLVVIAGCMRSYYIYYVELETYDVTWEGFHLWIWAAVEVNLGVICGCAPVLKTLLFPSRSRKITQYYASTANTFGSSSRRWSRKPNVIRSAVIRNKVENYVDLESLESGSRNSKPDGAANFPVGFQEIMEKANVSEESLGLPMELPSIPKAIFTSRDGRHSGFFKQENVINGEAESESTSWIDDKSVYGKAS